MNPQTHTSASPRKAAVRPGRYRAAFTLVEMLVVIVVILILAGIVFRMTLPAFSQANKALTVARLEKLKAAIEEFYAEYGHYPPVPYYPDAYTSDRDVGASKETLVQPIRYEFPSKGNMAMGLVGGLTGKTWAEKPLFTFGLLSFLMLRVPEGVSSEADLPWYSSLAALDSPQWGDYNTSQFNQERDEVAVARWKPFLDGAEIINDVFVYDPKQTYTNLHYTALDGWKREFVYISPPPHQSYLLFSAGPDGKYDSTDIHTRKKKVNRDNIYGDAGF